LSAAGAAVWPEVLWDGPVDAVLRMVDSELHLPLPVGRWHGPVLAEEMTVLERVQSPVLDVGCGPGRHAAALRESGHDALGIDSSARAVVTARRRGATAAHVSVFGEVPGAGTWATALLLDGNIGIGGDPVALLCRIHRLLRPGGQVLVEVEGPEVVARRFRACVHADGGSGAGFPWARVGVSAIGDVACRAGFTGEDVWCGAGRWFAQLRRVGE
jgi:SAM-dependent methyltransferase